MSRCRQKLALNKIYVILDTCVEPELVVEAVLVDSILANVHALSLLQTYGLKVDSGMFGSKTADREVGRQVMEEILARSRNMSTIRLVSLEHALETVARLRLSLGSRGHTQRLMEAIR